MQKRFIFDQVEQQKPTVMATFKNTVEHHNGNVIEVREYETRKEAKADQRNIMKQYGMIRHAGHVVNYSDHLEMHTNY